ncbi:MAG TPA: heavy-metal-associated domain-containing protein [Prosthecobacter sp.]
MKHILTLFLSILTFMSCVASDPATFVYQGQVAGVMCSACSNHVETAVKTLPGVRSVTITMAKDGGLPRLEIVSTSSTLKREDVVKALGEEAKTYDVRSLSLVQGK